MGLAFPSSRPISAVPLSPATVVSMQSFLVQVDVPSAVLWEGLSWSCCARLGAWLPDLVHIAESPQRLFQGYCSLLESVS